MGRFAKSSTVEVIQGLYVKQSAASPYWQLYFRLNAETVRASTRCRELEDAKRRALEFYYDYRRGDDGLRRGVSFQKLADIYLASIRHEARWRYHSETVQRHFLPHFSGVRDISSIGSREIEAYLSYRRGKSERAPVPQTLNRENTVLRQMFAHAVKQGWMKTAPRIEHLSERHTRRRRRHFTYEEYRQLHRTARRRIAEVGDDALRAHTRRQRELLYDVIMFLANSGMRVDEMKTVTWRNVDLEQGYVTLESAGKTRSSRRVVVRQTGVNALKRIRARREAWLDAEGENARIKPSEPVFALPNGKPVSNFKRGFDALVEAAGIEAGANGDKHALTSLRHTYATFSLTRKQGKRASMRALAMQMGTSERMIQRHYGHDEIADYVEELRGD